jgi:hypothetical protein
MQVKLDLRKIDDNPQDSTMNTTGRKQPSSGMRFLNIRTYIGNVRRKNIIVRCGRPFLIVRTGSLIKTLGRDAGLVCSPVENVGIGFEMG